MIFPSLTDTPIFSFKVDGVGAVKLYDRTDGLPVAYVFTDADATKLYARAYKHRADTLTTELTYGLSTEEPFLHDTISIMGLIPFVLRANSYDDVVAKTIGDGHACLHDLHKLSHALLCFNIVHDVLSNRIFKVVLDTSTEYDNWLSFMVFSAIVRLDLHKLSIYGLNDQRFTLSTALGTLYGFHTCQLFTRSYENTEDDVVGFYDKFEELGIATNVMEKAVSSGLFKELHGRYSLFEANLYDFKWLVNSDFTNIPTNGRSPDAKIILAYLNDVSIDKLDFIDALTLQEVLASKGDWSYVQRRMYGRIGGKSNRFINLIDYDGIDKITYLIGDARYTGSLADIKAGKLSDYIDEHRLEDALAAFTLRPGPLSEERKANILYEFSHYPMVK